MAAEPPSGVYFDTHAHLADRALVGVAEEVIARASESGVVGIVAVGYDLATSEASVTLAHRLGVWASVGVHPNSASEADDRTMARIRELAGDPRVVAVGETGLDYYRDRVAPAVQRRAFEAHLELADEVGKPVIVHDRDAHGDVMRLLLGWSRRRSGGAVSPGVLHCFSGDLSMAEEAVEAGLLISFAGNLTYPSARGLADVARRIDLGSVVVETDCPYLSPAPRRGERNEPRNVAIVVERLAALRGQPPGEVGRLTTSSALRLFGLEARVGQTPERTS